MKYIPFISLITILLFLSGCPAPPTDTTDILDCPGKPNIVESVRLLQLQKQNVQPFRATADCVISLPTPDGKDKKENVPGVLYFLPQDKILFAGNKFGAVSFGANETEFWMLVKPEMDSYWWGTKQQAENCRSMLLVNPDNVAEALGIVDVTTDWTLLHRENNDILDLFEDNKRKKRVIVNACDYRIERIEYYDDQQTMKVAVDLSDYATGRHGISVPKLIHIANFDEMGIEDYSLDIRIKQLAPYTPTEAQRKKVFARPSPNGYKDVYRLDEQCEFELEND